VRISCVEVSSFKRIEEVKITPDADRALIVIGGRNRQGKTSLLDALSAAFGGKRAAPSDPVRHGADEATIYVELNDGELTINRVIQPDGTSALEVRDRHGPIKSPQKTLDELVSGRFLDPLLFLALPAKEQRATLLRLIDGDNRIGNLDAKRERLFTERTEIGRDHTKAKGEFERLPPEIETQQPVDVAQLSEERTRLAEQQRAVDGLGAAHAAAARETQIATKALVTLNAEIEAVREKLRLLEASVPAHEERATRCRAVEAAKNAALDEAASAWQAVQPRREQVDRDLRGANEHNARVYAAKTQNDRRAKAEVDLNALGTQYDELTATIEKIDRRKLEILAAAKLPVDGIGIDLEQVTLNGVPLGQASGAEKLRVALALAVAANPGLNDVWVRDAAVLDEDSLALVKAHAESTGTRYWLERVGNADPGAIIIHDGRVG